MRLFAISDLHVDYPANAKWVSQISQHEYQQDWLIVAGDLSHKVSLLLETLGLLRKRFAKVLYVPGNHDLWLDRHDKYNSIEKHHQLNSQLNDAGVETKTQRTKNLTVIPLLGWYDFSFAECNEILEQSWMDFYRCRWPENFDEQSITDYFCAQNDNQLLTSDTQIVSFSHFLPRPDVFPRFGNNQLLLPILGTFRLDAQLRDLGSTLHVFGHSHLAIDKTLDGVRYINNACGYPRERGQKARSLKYICSD